MRAWKAKKATRKPAGSLSTENPGQLIRKEVFCYDSLLIPRTSTRSAPQTTWASSRRSPPTSLIAKEPGLRRDLAGQIATIVDSPISGEVATATTDAETMVGEARPSALDPKHMVVNPHDRRGPSRPSKPCPPRHPHQLHPDFQRQPGTAGRPRRCLRQPLPGAPWTDISQRGIELIETITTCSSTTPTSRPESSRPACTHTRDRLCWLVLISPPYPTKSLSESLHHPLTDSGIEVQEKTTARCLVSDMTRKNV